MKISPPYLYLLRQVYVLVLPSKYSRYMCIMFLNLLQNIEQQKIHPWAYKTHIQFAYMYYNNQSTHKKLLLFLCNTFLLRDRAMQKITSIGCKHTNLLQLMCQIISVCKLTPITYYLCNVVGFPPTHNIEKDTVNLQFHSIFILELL